MFRWLAENPEAADLARGATLLSKRYKKSSVSALTEERVSLIEMESTFGLVSLCDIIARFLRFLARELDRVGAFRLITLILLHRHIELFV